MFSKLLKKFRGTRKGQAMTEYIIIVAIVAIASIAVVTIFGKQIRAMFAAAALQLSGDDAAQTTDQTSGVDAEIGRDINDW